MPGIEQKQTLCWTCQNAVPDSTGELGCSWSRRLKPVEGWTAVETTNTTTTTYRVIDCPEYIPD